MIQIDLYFLRESLPCLVHSTENGLLRVARIVDKLRGFAGLDRAELGEVDVNGRDLVIEVCDNGPGISEEACRGSSIRF